jgi:hypothetical protein
VALSIFPLTRDTASIVACATAQEPSRAATLLARAGAAAAKRPKTASDTAATTRAIEERHGLAGALPSAGGLGAFKAPM